MDRTRDPEYQRSLAYLTGVLHGYFKAWVSANRVWGEFLERQARQGRRLQDYEIAVHHDSVLITIQHALKALKVLPEAELAKTLLLAMMDSQLRAHSEAMKYLKEHTPDHAWQLANATEDTQAYGVAWQALLVQSGLADDADGD